MGEQPMPERLKTIFQSLVSLITEFQPQEFAIEQVFMARNPDSALKLGQARGAAIVSAANSGLAVHEYSARQVKQAVVGTGGADKDRKSTRLNSSHVRISYAVFCLKKKKKNKRQRLKCT